MLIYFTPLFALAYTTLVEYVMTYFWRVGWRSRRIHTDLQHRWWTLARYLAPVAAGTGAALWYGSLPAGIAFAAATWLGVLAAHTDLTTCRIPKEACWWTLAVTAGAAFSTWSMTGLASAASALVIVSIAMVIVALLTRGGLGSGDVRLVMALAPLAAWSGYISFLYGLLIACVLQVPLRLLLKNRVTTLDRGYPFAPALLIGVIIAIAFTGAPGSPVQEWAGIL